MLDCEILWHVAETHLSHLKQTIAGFTMLHKQGVIRLKLRSLNQVQSPPEWTGLHVVLNKRTRLYYDLFDGPDINQIALNQVDYYFKRSYTDEHAGTLAHVHPLGLNYPVSIDGFNSVSVRCNISIGTPVRRLRAAVREIVTGNYPSVTHLQSPPLLGQEPRVLFLTRLWSPGDLPKADPAQLEMLNRMRARCVTLLKNELGAIFHGGVEPTSFAMKFSPEAVLADKSSYAKRNYISTVKRFPICVTTRGLVDSNGWKLGEYVAHSRAIVSERLMHQVPGDFDVERNYLDFLTPEDCLESTLRLVRDSQLRRDLMINNYRYYHAFVKPDSLILNTLAVALDSSE